MDSTATYFLINISYFFITWVQIFCNATDQVSVIIKIKRQKAIEITKFMIYVYMILVIFFF